MTKNINLKKKSFFILFSIIFILIFYMISINSVYSSSLTNSKNKIRVYWDGYIIRWDPINNASHYRLTLIKNGKELPAETSKTLLYLSNYPTSSDMFPNIQTNGVGNYKVKVTETSSKASGTSKTCKFPIKENKVKARWDGYTARWDRTNHYHFAIISLLKDDKLIYDSSGYSTFIKYGLYDDHFDLTPFLEANGSGRYKFRVILNFLCADNNEDKIFRSEFADGISNEIEYKAKSKFIDTYICDFNKKRQLYIPKELRNLKKGAVKWLSSNNNIAKVNDNGEVITNLPGICYVKAVCKGTEYQYKIIARPACPFNFTSKRADKKIKITWKSPMNVDGVTMFNAIKDKNGKHKFKIYKRFSPKETSYTYTMNTRKTYHKIMLKSFIKVNGNTYVSNPTRVISYYNY